MTPTQIRAWRESVGLSQQAVARRLPCGARTWQHWEAGTREPPTFLYRALRDLERELATDRRDG